MRIAKRGLTDRARPRAPWVLAGVVAAVAVTASACEKIEEVVLGSPPATPHEAYIRALEDAGLGSTALAESWLAAAEAALLEPIAVDPPYDEMAYYPAEDPSAAGYRVSLRRGQALVAIASVEPADSARVFLDLFQIEPESGPRRLASAADGSGRLEFEPSRDGEFVLRVQPELLRSVRLRLSINRAATLAFPVEGGGTNDIGSRFGAARDAGRRSHHGVDIFAPRGTPVLAVTEGTVSRVRSTEIGGLVVWLRDSRRRQSIYYAHLDRQLVQEGRRVLPGDTVGLVGNTGNARTTPPHLHFGIYRRGQGPVDPHPFIEPLPSAPPPLRVDVGSLGSWGRTTRSARLRVTGSEAEETLPPHTVVRVLGAAGQAYRVGLPDGRRASLRGSPIQVLDRSADAAAPVDAVAPLEAMSAVAGTAVLDRPAPNALPRTDVEPGERLAVLGRFQEYLFVERPGGERGWLGPPGAEPLRVGGGGP